MEGTSGSSQACLEEAGDMNDKPTPIAGSAPEERQSRFRQRRATGKALVVERVGFEGTRGVCACGSSRAAAELRPAGRRHSVPHGTRAAR